MGGEEVIAVHAGFPSRDSAASFATALARNGRVHGADIEAYESDEVLPGAPPQADL
jgi:hypothetical protein